MVHLDATLGEKLFEIPVGRSVAEIQRTANKIPSGGNRNPAKPEGILIGGLGRRVRFIEPPSPPRCDASTQQSRARCRTTGSSSVINSNQFANGRRFQYDVEVGIVGINVPIPVPVAYPSFGGWKDSLLGDTHM